MAEGQPQWLKDGLQGLERDPLSGQLAFRELDAREKGIDDISCLRSLPLLRKVQLSNNAISTLAELQHLPLLQEVDCHHNELVAVLDFDTRRCARDREMWAEGSQSIGPVVERANLSFNKIVEIRDLKSHRFLRELDISHNQIQTLGKGLLKLRSLKKLNLSYNKLRAIQGLPVSLKKLDVSHNALIDCEYLARCYELEELAVDTNKMASLSGVNACAQLRRLSISNNGISELEGENGVESLHEIETLVSVSLSGNPISNIPYYRERIILRLPRLEQFDGISVTPQDKVKCGVLVGREVPSRKEVWKACVPPAIAFTNSIPTFQEDSAEDARAMQAASDVKVVVKASGILEPSEPET